MKQVWILLKLFHYAWMIEKKGIILTLPVSIPLPKFFFSQCRKQIYCSWIGIWIEYCSITALTSCFDSRHLSLQEDQRLLYKILSSAQKFTNDFFSRVTEIKSSHFVYKKEKKLVECFSDQIIVVCIRLYMNCFSV